MAMFIRTTRLSLRPPFAEDACEVFAAIADQSAVRMMARAPWPYLPHHAQAFCTPAADPLALRFVIALPGKRGAPIIGGIGIDAADGPPELSFWIAPAHSGQGYASEAVAAVLDAAAVHGHGAIEAGHFLDNPASGAVLARAGFAETGEVRPVHSLGRGGELVLARRYSADVSERKWARMAAQVAA